MIPQSLNTDYHASFMSRICGQSYLVVPSFAILIMESSKRAISFESNKSDEDSLSRIGKKRTKSILMLLLMGQKRRFGMISTLGLSTTLMLTWEGVLVYFGFGLANGGSAGLVTSFVLDWAGFMAIMIPLAEFASMAPTSSGQNSRVLLSYLTGWLSVAVWQSIVAMGGILTATLIQGLLVLNYSNGYVPQGWKGTLLIWATVILSFVIEGFILYLHVLAFFAIIIPLIYLGERANAAEVFTTWNNDGGWSSTGLAFFVGIITNVGPFIGFGMLLAMLFTVGDIEAALETSFNYPFIQIFYNTTQSTAGTTVMVTIVLALSYAATFGQFAGASRQLWAFSRDRGPPMSSRLLLVNPKSFLPMNAIWTICFVSLLLGLINIGSEEALSTILSFTTSSWEAAAAIPLALLLWNWSTNKIQNYQRDLYIPTGQDTGTPLVWGPWKIPEPFGIVINTAGLIWITITFFSFWPGSPGVTAADMNFSVLLTGFWFLFGVICYFTHYHGPIIETNHAP
ncbi:amino acid permease-domain-containing protein [Xylaria digitata]|nr:amino acid permease-domain-containing protein [Xylaria digitata]